MAIIGILDKALNASMLIITGIEKALISFKVSFDIYLLQ
jgi:hypothetical protein